MLQSLNISECQSLSDNFESYLSMMNSHEIYLFNNVNFLTGQGVTRTNFMAFLAHNTSFAQCFDNSKEEAFIAVLFLGQKVKRAK